MKAIKITCCGACPHYKTNEHGVYQCALGACCSEFGSAFFKDCPLEDAEQTVDSISLENAVEIPVWRVVGAGEPNRLIDVRMDYKTLTALCDLIIKRKEYMKNER